MKVLRRELGRPLLAGTVSLVGAAALLGASLTFQACGPADSSEIGKPPNVHQPWPRGIPTGPRVSVTSLSPESATAGTGDLTLSITGSGFVQEGHIGTWVLWDSEGSPTSFLATTVNGKTELTALVPATLLTTPGIARLTVQSGDWMGDDPAQSKSLQFSITP